MVLEYIERGAYGSVHKVQNQGTSEYGAIKLIQIPPADEHSRLLKMQRELEIAQQLQRHPNVVSWVDVVMRPLGSNELAIIFEYAGGGDARRLLDHGPLPEPVARDVFKQIISGLAHCHAQVRHALPHAVIPCMTEIYLHI